MRTENTTVTCIRIFDAPRLDPISLVLRDDGGSGQVIVECYGEAWATYFGAIGAVTLVGFIAGASSGYMASRFERRKQTKAETTYLLRICEAVVEACKLAERKEGGND